MGGEEAAATCPPCPPAPPYLRRCPAPAPSRSGGSGRIPAGGGSLRLAPPGPRGAAEEGGREGGEGRGRQGRAEQGRAGQGGPFFCTRIKQERNPALPPASPQDGVPLGEIIWSQTRRSRVSGRRRGDISRHSSLIKGFSPVPFLSCLANSRAHTHPLAPEAQGKREKQNHRDPPYTPAARRQPALPRSSGQRAPPGRQQTSAHRPGMAFPLPSGIFRSVGHAEGQSQQQLFPAGPGRQGGMLSFSCWDTSRSGTHTPRQSPPPFPGKPAGFPVAETTTVCSRTPLASRHFPGTQLPALPGVVHGQPPPCLPNSASRSSCCCQIKSTWVFFYHERRPILAGRGFVWSHTGRGQGLTPGAARGAAYQGTTPQAGTLGRCAWEQTGGGSLVQTLLSGHAAQHPETSRFSADPAAGGMFIFVGIPSRRPRD